MEQQQPVFIEAFWPMPDTDFPAWREMHQHIYNNHSPKVQVRRLEELIGKWLPYPVFWAGGLLDADTPYGQYIWTFAVQIEQNRRWNLPEFVAGREFGRSGQERGVNGKTWRDANPYPRICYDRHISWDGGYILGLSEKSAAVHGGWEAYQKRVR